MNAEDRARFREVLRATARDSHRALEYIGYTEGAGKPVVKHALMSIAIRCEVEGQRLDEEERP